jgi:hypothetical protein
MGGTRMASIIRRYMVLTRTAMKTISSETCPATPSDVRSSFPLGAVDVSHLFPRPSIAANWSFRIHQKDNSA